MNGTENQRNGYNTASSATAIEAIRKYCAKRNILIFEGISVNDGDRQASTVMWDSHTRKIPKIYFEIVPIFGIFAKISCYE